MTTGAVAASRSKNVRQAPNSCSEPTPEPMPRSASSAGSIQRRSASSGTCSATVAATFARVVAASSVSSSPQRPRTISPSAQKLMPSPYAGERPSCHQTCSTRPSRYFVNSQARRLLPMPAGPMTETSRARCSRLVAWNRSLSSRSSSSRPTKGASSVSERPVRRRSATTRRATPGGDRGRLALERLVAGRLEHDGRGRRAPGRLPHQDRAGRRGRLEPGRGVDEVARDHALVGGADGHRRLAGQHPRAGGDAGAQRADRVDQVERRPDRALRVVLARHRRAPDRHDRVADELLDRAAVALDDVARQVEVAGQELPRLLRVAALGERREADQVGEQDRHEAALGDRGSGGRQSGAHRPGSMPRRHRAGSRTRRRTSRPAGWLRRTTGRPPRVVRRTPSRTCDRRGSRSRSWRRSRMSPSEMTVGSVAHEVRRGRSSWVLRPAPCPVW